MLDESLAPYYLASVYSRYSRGHVGAYLDISKIAARFYRRYGVAVFSPIAHGHGFSMHGGFPITDSEFWLEFDAPFVRTLNGLIVAMMDGWRESLGITHEIKEFKQARKPVFYLDTETLELSQ